MNITGPVVDLHQFAEQTANMDKDDIEHLHTTLYIGLTVAKYRPPKTHDRTELDAYRRDIADALVEHLTRSWELKRKPPTPAH